jgi:chemotaxis response regulator CheB
MDPSQTRTRTARENAIGFAATGGDGDGLFSGPLIKKRGGRAVAQDRATFQDFNQSEISMKTGEVDFDLRSREIAPKMIALVGDGRIRV